MKTTVGEIASLTGGIVENGDPHSPITGAAAIAEANHGQVTFFGNAKYLPALKSSRATAALVPLDLEEEIPPIKIKVANPSLAFAKVLEKFAPPAIAFAPGVHPSAVIGANVVLGKDVSIQPCAVIEPGTTVGDRTIIGAHVYVGHHSAIGSDCRIHPNVVLREGSILGNRVIIHSGTVVGSDGFGYEFVEGRHVKIPQIGHVQIDDDVEIGANVAIDRARFGRTWIQEGVKIDNLVQIAHNVIIGRHSIIVSQTGISGSSRLGNYVTLAGQVGLVGHIEVGEGAIIGAKSGISKSVPAGEKWFGYPAAPLDEMKRQLAYVARLSKLFGRVKKLEQILGEKGISLPPET